MNKLIIRYTIRNVAGLFLLFSLSCKKLVEVSAPQTGLNNENVYQSNQSAISVLNGIYSNITLSSNGLLMMNYLPSLSADELSLIPNTGNTQLISYYQNSLSSNVAGFEFWNLFYQVIFNANSAIGGLTASSTLTDSVKTQLLGEAYFMRAFSYFYLVSLYGDVPLVTGTDYTLNSTLPRSPETDVWQQVINDLKTAQNDLNPNFLDGNLTGMSAERVRPSRWAASALLARAYLYIKDYADAQTASSLVIGNSAVFGLSTLANAFLRAGLGNNEAILQFQPVSAGINTQEAQIFILPGDGPNTYKNTFYLSPYLMNAFETGDQRESNWADSVTANGTTYYYPYKYKVDTINADVTEYEMVLRLGEQYLIRAEAEANLNDLPDAAADLNAIRNRAGLPNTTAASQSDLLSAIQRERQVELFTEWGSRWLDLKRTGTVNEVMGAGGVCAAKGGSWNTDWQLYPLPLSDLKADPNLAQNPGY